MLRRFRHRLLVSALVGIGASGTIAVSLFPAAWKAVALCAAGAAVSAYACERMARRYLQSTIGNLRRLAEDVGRGRDIALPPVRRGDDLYKLNAAIAVLAQRLREALQEEKRLHAALRKRERMALLGELAASVAHEVNNPLDGVQGCARILRRSLDQPARRDEMLDQIDSGLARIGLIVRRLLTLAREHVVRPSPARIGEVAVAAVDAMQRKLESGKVRSKVHCPDGDDYALVDRPLMEGVFVNLIQNAIDSMPEGGEIDVRVAVVDAEVHVAIADTGCGIASDVLPHIFEPFFTTKGSGRGTGLGLAIASRILDAHGGGIDVAPRPGGGTVFTVRVPRTAEREPRGISEAALAQPAGRIPRAS